MRLGVAEPTLPSTIPWQTMAPLLRRSTTIVRSSKCILTPATTATTSLKSPCQPASACRHPRAELRRGEIATSFCSFGFELQGRCSAFTSWRARKRDPKTFSLAAHNQELVLRHMTFGLQQLFQISLERGLCFNHLIERLLHLGRQIICIDVLPLQFFPCHCLAPAWSDEKGIRYSSQRHQAATAGGRICGWRSTLKAARRYSETSESNWRLRSGIT